MAAELAPIRSAIFRSRRPRDRQARRPALPGVITGDYRRRGASYQVALDKYEMNADSAGERT